MMASLKRPRMAERIKSCGEVSEEMLAARSRKLPGRSPRRAAKFTPARCPPCRNSCASHVCFVLVPISDIRIYLTLWLLSLSLSVCKRVQNPGQLRRAFMLMFVHVWPIRACYAMWMYLPAMGATWPVAIGIASQLTNLPRVAPGSDVRPKFTPFCAMFAQFRPAGQRWWARPSRCLAQLLAQVRVLAGLRQRRLRLGHREVVVPHRPGQDPTQVGGMHRRLQVVDKSGEHIEVHLCCANLCHRSTVPIAALNQPLIHLMSASMRHSLFPNGTNIDPETTPNRSPNRL